RAAPQQRLGQRFCRLLAVADGVRCPPSTEFKQCHHRLTFRVITAKTGRLGECWNTQFVSLRQSGTFHPRKSGIPLTLRREHGHRSSQNKIVVRGALPHRCWIGSAAGGWLVVRAIVLLSVQDDRR